MPRGYILLSKSGRAPLVMFRVSEALSVSLQSDEGGQVVSNSMQSFLDCWQAWLTHAPSGTGDIMVPALHTFVKALEKLDTEEVLLTTQMLVVCPGDMSREHQCLVRELLESLEAMPLYSMARDLWQSSTSVAMQHAGNTGTLPSCCQTTHVADTMDCPYFHVTPAHFTTLLLLAWPQRRCDNNNGLLLRRQAVAQLSKTPLTLQNEVAQLNRQLDSISSYIQTCQPSDGSCHCVSTCS